MGDVRRVIRALEVFMLTGVPFSQQPKQSEFESPFSYRVVTLDMDRSLLYSRVNARVDMMLKDGLLD